MSAETLVSGSDSADRTQASLTPRSSLRLEVCTLTPPTPVSSHKTLCTGAQAANPANQSNSHDGKPVPIEESNGLMTNNTRVKVIPSTFSNDRLT